MKCSIRIVATNERDNNNIVYPNFDDVADGENNNFFCSGRSKLTKVDRYCAQAL